MKIWTDGGSRGNPGPSAWAFVTDTGHTEGGFIGLTTNNVAEYSAMLNALMWLEAYHTFESHQIYTDSRLLEGQLMCGWKVKSANLKGLHAACRSFINTIGVHIYYVPREQNKEADRLVNKILDAQQKG